MLVLNHLGNLYGYVFKISMFERALTAVKTGNGQNMKYIGTDGMVIDTIIHEMNVTPRYIFPRDGQEFGNVYDNRTLTGTLKDVKEKECHLAGNSRFITDYKIKDIEYTSFLYEEKMCVVIPKHSEKPKASIVYSILKPSTWLLILISLILCLFIIYLKGLFESISLFIILLELVSFIGLFIGTVVKIRCLKKRYYFIIFFIFFSQIMSNIIQTLYIKSYSTVNYIKDIDTLQELEKSNLKILSDLLSNFDPNITLKKLMINPAFKNNESTLDWFSSLKYICRNKNFASIGRKSEIDYAKYKVFLAKDGTRCLHTVKEHILTYSLAYIVPSDSPFLLKINRLILEMREAGLISYWLQKGYYRSQAHEKHINYKSLKFADLNIPLLILTVGYTLAFSMFICEINAKRIKKMENFRL